MTPFLKNGPKTFQTRPTPLMHIVQLWPLPYAVLNTLRTAGCLNGCNTIVVASLEYGGPAA